MHCVCGVSDAVKRILLSVYSELSAMCTINGGAAAECLAYTDATLKATESMWPRTHAHRSHSAVAAATMEEFDKSRPNIVRKSKAFDGKYSTYLLLSSLAVPSGASKTHIRSELSGLEVTSTGSLGRKAQADTRPCD
jgi:hypothetical protein